MRSKNPTTRLLGLALPSLALAGGLSALGYLRYFFQPRRLFLPDRLPQGVWDPSPFGLSVEDTWFAAEDGTGLHGWYIPHPRGRGTVLFCHGNTGNLGQQIDILRHLHRLRASVFAFDYRGYGRSEGEPSEAGVYRDVRAAWDHLVHARGVPPREILLFGHSLGGAIAIDAALDRPVGALVTQGTFTDVRSAARVSFPGVHLAARNQFRNIAKVARIGVPKLFIHGTADVRVPPDHAERLYAAAAEPKELYFVPGAEHTDVHRVGGLRYLWRLKRFRDRNLP